MKNEYQLWTIPGRGRRSAALVLVSFVSTATLLLLPSGLGRVGAWSDDEGPKAKKAGGAKVDKKSDKRSRKEGEEEEVDPACFARFEQLRDEYEKTKGEGPEVRLPLISKFAEAPCDVTVEYLEGFYGADEEKGSHLSVTRALAQMKTRRGIEAILRLGVPAMKEDLYSLSAVGEAFEERLPVDVEEWVVRELPNLTTTATLRAETEVWERIVAAIAFFHTPKRYAFLSRELASTKSAALKVRILESFAENKSAQAASQAKALVRDPDPTVQSAALACLFHQDAKKNRSAFEKGLKSKDWQVRVVSVRAMAELGSAKIIETLAKLLDDPELRVRIAAVRALTKIGGKAAAEALVIGMAKAETRLLDDYADSLARLSGRNLGASAVQWESWWQQAKNLPDGNFRAMSIESYSKVLAKESEKQTLLYYGLRVLSNHVAFVLDTSESMNEVYEPATPEEAPKGRTVAPKAPGAEGAKKIRMDVAKEELLQVLRRLEIGKRFNVVTFDSVIRDFIQDALGKSPETLEPMSGETRAACGKFVETFQPGGQTYLLRAIRQAFEYADLDTIYLLSDGAPTPSSGTPEEILAFLRRENRLRNVRVNTIGFGVSEAEKGFLIQIAEENFGVFIER
jgi:hypothetical protein